MSLTQWIDHRLDWGAFVLLAWAAFFVARRLLGRAGSARRLGALHAVVVGLACVLAFFGADWIGGRERARMQTAVQSLAPNVAQELQALGHAGLRVDVSMESSLYVAIAEAQRRWLARNPDLGKIFTYRFDGDGRIVYLVDAPNDRDFDGKLVGEHEIAHEPGSECTEQGMEMLRALCGVSTCQERPYEDDSGAWIHAFEPLRDAEGRIEGAVAVEFDARSWVRSEAVFRFGALGGLLLALWIYVAAAATTLFLRGQIDRRTEIEAELRRGEERLRAILDHDPDFIGLVGPDGNLLEVNPAGLRMVGVATKTELLGRSLEAALAPVQAERLRALYRQTAGNASSSVEYQIKGRGNEARWVHSHAVPLGPRFGFSRTYLIVTRDVHEQKVAQEEAERLQKELLDASRAAGMAEIATGVLHNIGNVINTANIACSAVHVRLDELGVDSLKRLADILAEQTDDLPRFFAEDPRGKRVVPLLSEITRTLDDQRKGLREELDTLGRALDHVKSVIHSQQALARASAVYELIDPREIAEEALHLNGESIDRHGIQLVREFAQTIPLQLDRHKIMQILINLITNAKEAVKDCPAERRRIQMILATQCIGGRVQVTFEVRDHGVGILAENLPKLFTHGFSTRPGGHGFGLHSSALAAREMGGTLTVQSNGPGHGAVFTLRVPARVRTEMVAA
ncbi:MAG: ATP-binding protein [Planctomycetota bacterium]